MTYYLFYADFSAVTIVLRPSVRLAHGADADSA